MTPGILPERADPSCTGAPVADVRAALVRADEALLDHDIVVDDLRREIHAAVERFRVAVRDRDRAAAYVRCLEAWVREFESEAV